MTTPFPVPVLGICAAGSGMGKTTLLRQLIPELMRRGIRVSVIKHAHHAFDIDHPGKDSFLIRQAGAVQTMVASSQRIAVMTELNRATLHDRPQDEPPELQSLLTQLNPEYADLILVEGFKQAGIPKLEVYRPSVGLPLLTPSLEGVLAVVSDAECEVDCPVLALNNIPQIASCIIDAMDLPDSEGLPMQAFTALE